MNKHEEKWVKSKMELHPTDETFTFREALEYLKVSKSFLYKMTSKKMISHLKPNGGKIYFKKSVLDAWLGSNEVNSTRVLEEELNNKFKNETEIN